MKVKIPVSYINSATSAKISMNTSISGAVRWASEGEKVAVDTVLMSDKLLKFFIDTAELEKDDRDFIKVSDSLSVRRQLSLHAKIKDNPTGIRVTSLRNLEAALGE